MCVIAVKEPGKTLPDEIIDKCWARNAQGAGYVFIPNDKRKPVVTDKGIMDLPKLKTLVAPFQGKSGTLILHFRIQSRGGVTANLTHPFDFSQDNADGLKRYLFHNGTARLLNTTYQQSDSSVLADLLKHLDNDDALLILQKLVKDGFGRFVAVIGRDVFTYGDNESEVKDGIWFSNLKHEVFDGKKLYVGDGADDYPDYSTRSYYATNPRPQMHQDNFTSQKQIGHAFRSDEREDIFTTVAGRIATIRNTPLPEVSGYITKIIHDFRLRNFSNEDVHKLKNLITTAQNPLLEFFKQTYLS